MTKADLVEKVAEETSAGKVLAEQVLRAAFRLMGKALEAGDTAGWPGFGQFKVVERAARTGMNPNTGQKMAIAARKAVKFSASGDLKVLVNRGEGI